MGRSLVLNATFEPLAVVSDRRAVVLVLADKADLVHGTDRRWHAERLEVEVPSVVRLRTHVRVPYRRLAPLNRRAVFVRDAHACQYCGRKADSIDHVVPKSRGGAHVWENVVAACSPCNTAKRDRLVHETSMRLRSHPVAPRYLSWVAASVGQVPAPWRPYLGEGIGLAVASA
jgi:5-methylcytosine-specific restriction endonuclease McrA